MGCALDPPCGPLGTTGATARRACLFALEMPTPSLEIRTAAGCARSLSEITLSQTTPTSAAQANLRLAPAPSVAGTVGTLGHLALLSTNLGPLVDLVSRKSNAAAEPD